MEFSKSEMAEYERAIFDIQRIKNGFTAELSVAQITFLNTNMSDAYLNLPEEQFVRVYSLFQDLILCKRKTEMGIQGYVDTAVEIIKQFDKIAPYEKYCGQDERAMAAMMEEIRSGK